MPIERRGRGRPRKSAAPPGLILDPLDVAGGPIIDAVAVEIDDAAIDDNMAAALDMLDDLEQPQAAPSRIVSLSQLATLLGKSRNIVRRWISEGMPVVQKPDNAIDGSGWQLDIAAVFSWREDQARAAGGGADGEISKDEAARRKLVAEAELAEFNLGRVRRETLLLGDVVSAVTDEYADVRARVRALPARLASRLAGAEQDEIFRILRAEIDECLSVLSYDARLARSAAAPAEQDDAVADEPGEEED
ncbi:MAG: hypothetical protein ACT6Q8_24340 [Niveispirillum sp.]|uniref:hypothetical protein n=1 Tax=Niveispirillum sp. TaxID=1917217 RepID=UPI0040373BD6